MKYRSDDGPAYCTIFIVGHILIPAILLSEKYFSPSLTFQMIIWPIITIIFSLWLLPKIKGAFIAFQIFVKINLEILDRRKKIINSNLSWQKVIQFK